MSDKKKDISKVPAPIEPLLGSILNPHELSEPNWILWKQKTKIMLWEAAFLCFDIDPHKHSYRDIDHYDLHTLEIGVCLTLLKGDLFLKDFFSVPYTQAQGEVSNFDLVKLPELAAWAINRGYDIPEELAALAKKLDTDSVAHSENQAANLYPNRKQTRIALNRAFLQDCIDKGISPKIEAIWKHIIENAGKPDFLFKTANKITATMINEDKVRKKNLARRLKRFLNKSKN